MFFGVLTFAEDAFASVGRADVTVTVAGVSATSDLGNETVTGNALVVETGVVGNTALGNETATADATFAVTGLSSTSSLGNESVTASALVAPQGAQGLGTAGSVNLSGAAVSGVSGVGSTGTLGDESVVGTAVFSVSGVSATTGLGNETVSLPKTVEVTGVSATSELGNETVTGTATVSPTGEEATSELGNEIVSTGVSVVVAVTGVEAKNNFNPEFGLTLDNTFGVRTAITSNFGGTNSTFAGEAQLPSSFSGGAECLFDMGGAFHGTFLGIAKISNVYNLRYRAGDGRSSVQTATAHNALKNVPISELSQFFDGGVHTLVWDIKPSSQGRIRLFIDGQLIIDESTSGALGVNGAGVFAGGNEGGWGQGFGNSVAGGQSDTNLQNLTAWSGTITNGLRHYQDELIDVTSVSVSTELNAIATPSGVEATGELGNETVVTTSSVTVVIEGNNLQANTAVGNETVTGTATFIPTGQEATSGVGSPTIIGAGIAGVQGQSVTGDLGDEGVTGDANVSITTGVVGTTALGNEEVIIPVMATGVDDTGSVGNETVIGDSTVVLTTGVEGTTELGNETVAVSIVVSVNNNNIIAVGVEGSLTATGDSNFTPTGEEAIGSVGDEEISISTTIAISGLGVTASLGEETVLLAIVVPVSGEEATGSVGDETVTANSVVIPTGEEATSSLGNETIELITPVDVTGVEALAQVLGETALSFILDANFSVTGLSTTGNIGNVLVYGNIQADGFTSYSEVSVSQTPNYNSVTGVFPEYSNISVSQTPNYSDATPDQNPDWDEEAA